MNTATLPFLNLQKLIIGAAMLLAAGLAVVLTPRAFVADPSQQINLEAMIPKQFGEWRLDDSVMPLQVSPDVQAKLDKIYNQTISRTYLNGNGNRVMLSIAYGGDQSDSMALHKPEICYPAQGFEIRKNKSDIFPTGKGDIPVKRLVATLGNRIEPITYWTTIGDTVATGGIKWKIQQMKYGLTGKIPDGLLFRISSIQANEVEAYKMQDDFSRALLGVLTTDGKKRIIGNLNSLI